MVNTSCGDVGGKIGAPSAAAPSPPLLALFALFLKALLLQALSLLLLLLPLRDLFVAEWHVVDGRLGVGLLEEIVQRRAMRLLRS